MSRYAWPGSKKRGHSGVARVRWDLRTSGLMAERAGSSARVARAVVDSALRVPGGDADLWVPIGPAAALNTGITSNPRVTGRTRDIAVSGDGMRVYAATAGGGVWYSNDAGTSWSPVGNWSNTPTISSFVRSANALSCGCLLVTFGTAADGSGDDVYVGTGETRGPMQGIHGDHVAGAGVLHLVAPLADAVANPFASVWQREAPNLAGRGIYRLARDPNNSDRLVAATDIGLFTRTGPFQQDRPWSRVKTGPLDFDADDDKWTTDVLWTAAGRLFVGLIDDTRFSDTGVYISTHGTDGPFNRVDLDGINDPRKIRIGLAVAPNDFNRVYVLSSGPKLWRIDGTSGRRIRRVPKLLFGTGDQSEYDLAIAVDPRDSNRIVLGGAGFDIPRVDGTGALLFQCNVQAQGSDLVLDFSEGNQRTPTDDPTYIGIGVHDDVHQTFFVDVPGSPAPHLWVACDGGVFQSTRAARSFSFAARNTGLAAVQCGFVANHPTCDGLVFTGTQDNGVLFRIGDTMWECSPNFRGDGGCVIVHPDFPNTIIGHEHNARWHSNRGVFSPPVFRTGSDETRAQLAESRASSFYSAGDVRKIGGHAAVAIGTNRVWLAESWNPNRGRDTSWVTLPSATDPLEDDANDTKLDTFHGRDGTVIACRWASDTRLVVLCRRAVLLLDNDEGDWKRKVISYHDPKCGDIDNSDIPVGKSDWVPPRGEWTDLAIYDNLGTNGRFYVATTGFVEMDDDTPKEFDRLDTLWWYDGTGKFFPTGLRNHNTPPDDVGTEAPALAVLVDPDDKNTVYVGTSVGVWRGTLTLTGDTPNWKWSIFSNGLPETAVYDLSFFNHTGLKLLRAALGSRGIWEVDLSQSPRPVARTFARVHAFDTRRGAFTSLNNPVAEADDELRFLWYVSPDVRIRPAPGGPVPPVPDGDIDWTSFPGDAYTHELWTFQTAFRVAQPLCRPDGVWTEQFQALLRTHFGQIRITTARWNQIVTAANVFQNPWGNIEPTELDLFELIVEQGSLGWTIPRRPVLDRRAYNVDVLVHHRHQQPVPRDQVRVALLRRVLPDNQDTWGAVALSATWKTRVTQLLSGQTLPPGFVLPDGWVAAGSPRMASPRQEVDASHPRVVTFDVNFTAVTGTRRPFVLLAVVGSDVDPVSPQTLAGDTLEDLVQFSHHTAARVIRV